MYLYLAPMSPSGTGWGQEQDLQSPGWIAWPITHCSSKGDSLQHQHKAAAAAMGKGIAWVLTVGMIGLTLTCLAYTRSYTHRPALSEVNLSSPLKMQQQKRRDAG